MIIKRSFPAPVPAEIVPHTLYLGTEHQAFVHNCRLVRLKPIDFPPGSLQLGPMSPQASTVPIPPFLERLGHSLLIDNQVGDHFFDAGHPLLQLLVLLGHRFPLERQMSAQAISLEDKIRQPWIFPLPPSSTFVPPRQRHIATLMSLRPLGRHNAALGDCRQPKKTIG